ncbi:MAG TPA: class I SAM-dependent methyltransferase [Thermodesulfobacteriota bacterium]|nr:class I SAM-dependent methyltransferase [Thermodesulfobacteriota bacterium]
MVERSAAVRALRLLGRILPGDFLKTAFYLNVIARPRAALRVALFGFYRMDHVYAVLREFGTGYRGRFSVLEFGTAAGYAFRKILYATRYLGLTDRVVVHGFDSFEGLPAPVRSEDADLVAGDDYVAGQYRASYEALEAYCRRRYPNARLHKGDFGETLTEAFLASLRQEPPILVWFDCNYYRSARVVFERLLPVLPSGCVLYFDDYDWNYGSRFTGEARLVHEINTGRFGDGVELVLDPALSLLSRRVYRFVARDATVRYERVRPRQAAAAARLPSGDSPLP